MNKTKSVCIFFYIIVIVLFTVGYSSQTIITGRQVISLPPNEDGTVTTISASEVLKFNSLMISSNNNPSVDYSNINNISSIIFKTLFALCISITSLLSFGVLLSFLNKIFISKIILLIVLIFMLILLIVLLYLE